MELEILLTWAFNQGVPTAVLAFVLLRLESKLAGICLSNQEILTILKEQQK